MLISLLASPVVFISISSSTYYEAADGEALRSKTRRTKDKTLCTTPKALLDRLRPALNASSMLMITPSSDAGNHTPSWPGDATRRRAIPAIRTLGIKIGFAASG
ncbi:hypothetical protein P154DRAFT_520637 [Amniculicola lignicola CBS 123094]|uniref:Secreted protein n=1 Tax=Amniculicola lignicola CBS 123094 TaxID=1392246 RepID=A0A6A5WLM8_9PLEO|nr:hypothetical protein P154DRAFT_520637 [Amniculicola lignicola CBS 123094]